MVHPKCKLGAEETGILVSNIRGGHTTQEQRVT